jgi:hypothetical protein
VPEHEQDFLWNHTREIREKREAIRAEIRALEAEKEALSAERRAKRDEEEVEIVRKKRRGRSSPTPVLNLVAGGKATDRQLSDERKDTGVEGLNLAGALKGTGESAWKNESTQDVPITSHQRIIGGEEGSDQDEDVGFEFVRKTDGRAVPPPPLYTLLAAVKATQSTSDVRPYDGRDSSEDESEEQILPTRLISRPHQRPAPKPDSDIDPEEEYPGYGRGYPSPPSGPFGRHSSPLGIAQGLRRNPGAVDANTISIRTSLSDLKGKGHDISPPNSDRIIAPSDRLDPAGHSGISPELIAAITERVKKEGKFQCVILGAISSANSRISD